MAWKMDIFGKLRLSSSIIETFNPSLQKLVSLGNNYVQAFQGEKASEVKKYSNISVSLQGSKRRYEMEVRNRASALEKQNSQLWGEKRRGRSQHEVQREAQVFLRESLREAEKEELRRYRFLAEKHFVWRLARTQTGRRAHVTQHTFIYNTYYLQMSISATNPNLPQSPGQLLCLFGPPPSLFLAPCPASTQL
uniref:Uncharacterized protein n=1 Tax=Erpetoichthys calabaricus TaxID=27687 RepID=A0A8C4SHT7_ERPCA